MPHPIEEQNVEEIIEALRGMDLNSGSASDKHVCLMTLWNNYFQKGTLEDHQRLCADLGLDSDLPSKKKCRQELKSVNVNVKQFLESKNKPGDVKLFKNRRALAQYTRRTHSFFPKRKLPKGCPLRLLMKDLDI
ncbi:hypothetical protein NM208_g11918 [Fusarium decemcellulare]|uniref:Uncharacterized protein n=1 Tax=Fusarium decemcellulare TaxID=57161 RepID=A0ACC1RRE1_9HYPO|nr:hypothetical protein NM208_g11918 [Fusarium decemcellulare]